jgi:two-component sensor histidine kinase
MSTEIYKARLRWKRFLLVGAVAIGAITLWYTNDFVQKLRQVERQKVHLWAEASRQLANPNNDSNVNFIFEVIRDNRTVPVILTDEQGNINGFRNLDSIKMMNPAYIDRQLRIMEEQHQPIEIDYYEGKKVYIYYKDSILLTKLQFYPLIMLLVISLFIGIAYLGFNASRRSEQNRVWAGMARETAHQIGTPLSSLMGWLEILKSQNVDDTTISEIAKDIDRLEIITDRFSKIGSKPSIESEDVLSICRDTLQYLERRSPRKIEFELKSEQESIFAPLNRSLFSWVIENLVRNGVDSMEGEGRIEIELHDHGKKVYIDISDTGKGIRKSDFNNIFKPGFTTKTRGWGLGLSLAKRIIESYHGGRISVLRSERERGSTFRIVLFRA